MSVSVRYCANAEIAKPMIAGCSGLPCDRGGKRAIRCHRLTRLFVLLGLVLLSTLQIPSIYAWGLSGSPADVLQPALQSLLTPLRRVYAPYNVPASEAAVFWFGRVTPSENYTDVRIRYTDESLLLGLGIMDRLLWYDTTPSAADLTAWDSVSLYLSRSGVTGATLDAGCYRFDAQLAWWEENYQTAYRGDANTWTIATLPFTTSYGWNGNVPNNDSEDDRGWMLYYTIPFAALGLDGPPAQGTVWGFGVAVHDRDSAAGPPLADQTWPETMSPSQPETWGQLVFGLKPAYVPDRAVAERITVIRQGLDGAVVTDADVGGSSICGDPSGPDFFPTWGTLNWAGKEFLNVQHVDAISEWPCFSKYYVTFPLDALPAGKAVLSARLTLYQFGNAGEGTTPGPQSSYIEVLTVGEDWDEETVTWNSAPLAEENVAGTWVDPLAASPPWPGIPREWDVSGAVAEAYAAGEPLRLALYSPDWPFHSGKYFYTSDIGGGGEGRPTLTIAWSNPVASLSRTATPHAAVYDDAVTHTLALVGYGGPLTLTDTLPAGLGAPQALAWEGTTAAPTYDAGARRLTWRDAPPSGQRVLVTYTTQVATHATVALVSRAALQGIGDIAAEASTTVVANPYQIALPLVLRRR